MSDRGSEVSRDGYQRYQQCAEGLFALLPALIRSGMGVLWHLDGTVISAARIEGRRSPGRGISIVSSVRRVSAAAYGWVRPVETFVVCLFRFILLFLLFYFVSRCYIILFLFLYLRILN